MQFAMICEPCIFMGKSILQYNDRTVNYCKMIYFHFRADHYFLDRRATFLEHIIFSHLQIVHDFLLVGKYLVEEFFNIKSHHKDSREDLLDYSPWHKQIFFSTLSCVGIFKSLPGGITHLSYTVTLRRFVISILQKMLWINCSPTMVDCGPSIKPHCASNRGTVHRTEAPSVNFFFFFPETNPMLWEGSQW